MYFAISRGFAARWTLPVVLIHCVTSNIVSAQSGGGPSGHPDYSVNSIEAKDDDTSKGNRSSSSKLQMVNTGHRSATLTASTSGTKEDKEPDWSGFSGADSYDKTEGAQWSDSASSTATAEAIAGSASVSIEVVDLDPKSTKFNDSPLKTTVGKAVQKLGARARLSLTPSIGVTSDCYFEQWNSDKHNDPAIAVSKQLNGTATLGVGLSGNYRYTLSIGSISLSPVDIDFSFTANGGELVFTNFTNDWSKPADERWSGSWSLSISATASVQRVFRFGAIQSLAIDGIDLKAGIVGSAAISASGSATEDKGALSLSTGDVGISLDTTISYSDGRTSEMGTVLNIPILSNFSYSIPVHHRTYISE